MVTIGPVVVLGLLGVTFHIGARPVPPVATNVPIIRQLHSRSQSDLDLLEPVDHPRSESGLQTARTLNTPSEDALQSIPLSNSGAGLQRNRRSGRLDGTVAVSPNEHPNRWAGASSASEQRTTEGTSNNAFVLSRSRRPAMAASASTARRLPPREEHKTSATINPSAISSGAIVNEQDGSTGRGRNDFMAEALSNPLAPHSTKAKRSQDKSPRSFRGVWKTGPGNTSDPEQVLQNHTICFAVEYESHRSRTSSITRVDCNSGVLGCGPEYNLYVTLMQSAVKGVLVSALGIPFGLLISVSSRHLSYIQH